MNSLSLFFKYLNSINQISSSDLKIIILLLLGLITLVLFVSLSLIIILIISQCLIRSLLYFWGIVTILLRINFLLTLLYGRLIIRLLNVSWCRLCWVLLGLFFRGCRTIFFFNNLHLLFRLLNLFFRKLISIKNINIFLHFFDNKFSVLIVKLSHI